MKSRFLLKVGHFLMKKGKLKIRIVDDETAYFTPEMISIANASGFSHIERYSMVDKDILEKLLSLPTDIIILDIKGTAEPTIAKDGFGLAKILFEQTNTFIVITSAHKFHLHEYHQKYDYVINQRLLTAVDFVHELKNITDGYLLKKIKMYQKLIFKIGFKMTKSAIVANPN